MTTITVELIGISCASCGVMFGLTEGHEQQLRRTGNEFWCPNGHSLNFYNSLEEQVKKLKKELSQEKEASEYWRKSTKAEEQEHNITKRQLSSTKGQLTKTKKRIGNGVCPCCSRHFTNLEKHMNSKHPEYKEGDR